MSALRDHGNVYIDEICASSGYAMGKVSAILLTLEFSGVVKSLPGNFTGYSKKLYIYLIYFELLLVNF